MQFFKRNRATLILLLVFQFAFSQNYFSKNYSTADGLPNNAIYSVFKDSRGVLWIGTENGVSAIKNGVIHNYNQEDGFAYNNCWSIVEDKNHNLWFGSFGGGLTYYDGISFKVFNEKNGLVGNNVRKLFIHNNTLYVGCVKGLSTIDISTFKITSFTQKSEHGVFQVMDFFEYKSNIYFGTNEDGIWQIDKEAKRIKLITYDYPIFSVFKDKDSILVGKGSFSNDGINKISLNDFYNNRKSKTYFGYGVYWSYTKDKRNTTYGVSNAVNYSAGGLCKIEGGKTIGLNDLYGIQTTQAWSLFYDNINDFLYVGTMDKGLYEIHLNNQIKQYTPNYFKEQKIEINAIDAFNNNICLLTTRGLYLKNNSGLYKKTSTLDFSSFYKNYGKKNIKNDTRSYYKEFLNRKIDELEFRYIKIYNGNIWVNTTFGLFKLDDKGTIKEYYPIFSGVFDFINENDVIYQEPYSNVYLLKNLSKYPLTASIQTKVENNPKDILDIIKIESKSYYVSRYSGLYCYQNNTFKSYLKDKIWTEKEFIKATKNNKNHLVLANSFGDVFIVDDTKKFKIIKTISHKELIGNTISFLSSYKDFLLIGTEKGMNIYKDGKIRLIDEEQGLINKTFKCSYVDESRLLIGTTDGLYEIDLNKILNSNKNEPKIRISDVTINTEKYHSKFIRNSIYNNDLLELEYDQNNVSFRLFSQGFMYPRKLRFSYKLNGLKNTKWSEWSNDTKINFPYLPYGKYDLSVRIKDLNSGEITTQKVQEIIIKPPFWVTWWFILFLIVAIGALGYAIYNRRIKYLTNKEHEKGMIQKRLAETKMEALQSQMNPHFIFNAMNSIQNYIIDNNIDDALMYMGDFSKLIRQTLNNSSKQSVSLDDEIHYLETYIKLENLRLNERVTYKLTIDKNIDLHEIMVPPMLIQPFVENVFLHAFDKNTINPTLTINFRNNQNLLVCEIIDNGKGMNSEVLNNSKNSKGIMLVKERIRLIQNSLSEPINIISSPDKGTIITLILNSQLR
jgi:ligand-binding sensor domain-containing protein